MIYGFEEGGLSGVFCTIVRSGVGGKVNTERMVGGGWEEVSEADPRSRISLRVERMSGGERAI